MSRISTDKTEQTRERKFHELGVREVLVDEIRDDERGRRRYVEAAYWEDSASKDSDTELREGRVRLQATRGRIYADGVNSFNVHYQETGNSRIKEHDVRGVVSFRRMDNGLFVPRLLVPEVEAKERVEWERESFVRDIAAEIEEVIERYRQRALENLYFETQADRRGTTYAGQVAAGNADATALVGNPATTDASFDYTGTVAYLAGGGLYEGRSTGALFSGVTIPVGSTINSAVGQVYFCDAGATSMTSRPCFHAHDDSPNFATTQSIHPRTRTTLGTQWGSAGMGTGWKSTGNVASSLQEVINLAGWNSGQSITMIHLYGTTNNGIAYVSTYERNTSQAAKLDIDYSAAATGGRKNPLGYPLRGPFGGPLG